MYMYVYSSNKGIRYLRDTLTEFLVRLLECQANRMWTFDGFFVAADDLLQKHRLYLFSVMDSELYHIYMDPTHRFSELQKCVQEQTYTHIKSPCFMFHNQDLKESVSLDEPVRSYPVTSAEEPIVVLPLREGTSLTTRIPVDSIVNLVNELNPKFESEDSSSRDDDYRAARSMCSTTALILKAISQAASACRLLSKSSRDCRYAARQKYSSLKSSVKNIEDRYSDIRQIVDSAKMKSTTLFTTITLDGHAAEEKFEQINNKLDSCASLLGDCKERHKKLEELTRLMDCFKQENLRSSVERTSSQMSDILQKFSEYRKSPRLSYHEKKLYGFDKTSMTYHYQRAVSYLKKVQHSMASTFTSFKRWHSAYIKVIEMHEKVDAASMEVSRQLQEYVSYVKVLKKDPILSSVKKPSMKQRQLAEQVKTRVNVISQDMSESKQIAQESRIHMESLSSLMLDDLEDCDLSD